MKLTNLKIPSHISSVNTIQYNAIQKCVTRTRSCLTVGRMGDDDDDDDDDL